MHKGYNLTAGASVTFSFSGTLSLGFNKRHTESKVSGQQYLITVVGDEALASIVVVAT